MQLGVDLILALQIYQIIASNHIQAHGTFDHSIDLSGHIFFAGTHDPISVSILSDFTKVQQISAALIDSINRPFEVKPCGCALAAFCSVEYLIRKGFALFCHVNQSIVNEFVLFANLVLG